MPPSFPVQKPPGCPDHFPWPPMGPPSNPASQQQNKPPAISPNMFDENSIGWFGPVDEAHRDDVVKGVRILMEKHAKNDDPNKGNPKLYLSSSGGSVDVGFQFYDMATIWLNEKGFKLNTIATGQVSSMAVIVYMIGATRLISPNAHMLLHPIRKTYFEKVVLTGRDIKTIDTTFNFLSKRYIRTIVEKCDGKLKEATLRRWIKDEKVLTSDEAVKYGLAHKILEI